MPRTFNIKDDVKTWNCPPELEQIANECTPDIKNRDDNGNWRLYYTNKNLESIIIMALYDQEKDRYMLGYVKNIYFYSIAKLMKKNNFKFNKENYQTRVVDYILKYLL